MQSLVTMRLQDPLPWIVQRRFDQADPQQLWMLRPVSMAASAGKTSSDVLPSGQGALNIRGQTWLLNTC